MNSRVLCSALREAEALAEKLNDERRRGLVSALLNTINCYHWRDLTRRWHSATGLLRSPTRLGDLRAPHPDQELSCRTCTGIEATIERAVELAMANLAAIPADDVSIILAGPDTGIDR